ncbi:MAG: 4-hydroxy-3-methylbut-2-enyl diphosphate reductase [Dehalococcoidia bacterium]
MKIEKAEKLGLCFGVRRAITMLKEAVSEHGEIETLGPVAHNRLLVETLGGLGVKLIERPESAQGKTLAITTHGTTPEVLAEIKARNIQVIDTTCPIVRRAQTAAKGLAEAGFYVVIFGQADHSEVKGLLGYTGNRGMAALSVGQLDDWEKTPSRLGILSQTTQTRSAFTDFASQLVSTVGPKTREIRVANTLCQVTQAQQEAAMRLARRSQMMIVIGGRYSANARHLVEICAPIVETHLVETDDEVESCWFSGKQHVGVTAGASTPDEAVDALIARLESL